MKSKWISVLWPINNWYYSNMNLDKLWKMGRDSEAWRAQSLRWQRVGHNRATEQQQHYSYKTMSTLFRTVREDVILERLDCAF